MSFRSSFYALAVREVKRADFHLSCFTHQLFMSEVHKHSPKQSSDVSVIIIDHDVVSIACEVASMP